MRETVRKIQVRCEINGKPATLEDMRRIEVPCGDTYISVITQMWAEHVAPTEQELAAARDALAACMRGRGGHA